MSEQRIQIQVSNYLKLQYPNVYFNSESSGIRVTIGTALKMKKQRSKHKQLDFVILEPRKGYNALIIELKNSKDDLYNKNGTRKKSEHLDEQQESIDLLNSKGYLACFGCGFDECKEIIDNYLK